MSITADNLADSLACQRIIGNSPVEEGGVPAELKGQLETLAHDLGRLVAVLGADAAQQALPDRHMLLHHVQRCSEVVGQMGGAIEIVRQRLGRADSLIHEQGLQLQARVTESQTDGLTGIANRRAFDREFGERCATAHGSHCPLYLMLFDIDHFKGVNDSRGHHVGDALLRGIAQLLRDALPTGAFLARYGGEEFAVVLTGMHVDHAIETVECLRRLVCSTLFCYEGQRLSVTISCGLAQLGPKEHQGHLLHRADLALYAAKQAGRNRTFWNHGGDLHLATVDELFDPKSAEPGGNVPPSLVVDLGSVSDRAASPPAVHCSPYSSVLTPRSTRAYWCDGSMLFWYIDQRIAEWRRGGDPFCVLALDLDHSRQIAQFHGQVALQFMLRAQMLHLDSNLRDMDIVARMSQSRMVVVVPRSTAASLMPCLTRLHKTMARFAFPTLTGLVDYSVGLGIAEAAKQDNASQIVLRAEAALTTALSHGTGKFFLHDGLRAAPVHVEQHSKQETV